MESFEENIFIAIYLCCGFNVNILQVGCLPETSNSTKWQPLTENSTDDQTNRDLFTKLEHNTQFLQKTAYNQQQMSQKLARARVTRSCANYIAPFAWNWADRAAADAQRNRSSDYYQLKNWTAISLMEYSFWSLWRHRLPGIPANDRVDL